MAAFRCFMMYDYQREFFFLYIKRGFSTTPQWNDTRLKLEKTLQENKGNPKNYMNLNTDFGVFKCKYDPKARCYFILLSSPEVDEQFQHLTLQRIFDIFMKVPNYVGIQKIEIEKKYSGIINQTLEECEIKYQKESGFGSQVSKQSQTNIIINPKYQNQRKQNSIHQKDFCSLEVLLLIYRGFMMYDYNRQFFFMFIRKGFPLDKSWTLERNQLEKEILSKFQNAQKEKEVLAPKNFLYKGTFGIYRALYDEQAKCYFILLSRFGSPQQQQSQLLSSIYETVLKIQNYITMKYDSLESQIKSQIEYLIDENEYSTRMIVDPKFIDTKVFEEKLMRQNKQDNSSQLTKDSTQRGPLLYEPDEQILIDQDPQFTQFTDQCEKQLLYDSKGCFEKRKK